VCQICQTPAPAYHSAEVPGPNFAENLCDSHTEPWIRPHCPPLMAMCWVREAVLWRAVSMRADDAAGGQCFPGQALQPSM
jgi:hypothetical protein